MSNAAQAYEAEQNRLKAEYDGQPQDDVQITIPQEPEVNPEVWKDVEPILFRGFLTISAEINGVHFVFKNLNHHEFDLLRFNTNKEHAFWNVFLAHAVFMVDGYNVLSDRNRTLSELAATFGELPKQAKATIIRHISEVNRRASVAVALTEAYAMEQVSRFRWMQLKGLDLTSVSVTGIEGTHRLGLNWAQMMWRAINLAEDRNEEHEREWENAKFIGSCFAGKGVQKIYAQDTERRRKEREEKLTRKDKLLREMILGEKPEESTTVLPGAVIKAPKTVEELADQLEKDLRGDKDWHDRVIEEHENRIRQAYQRRQEQQKQAMQANEEIFGDRSVTGNSGLEGLSRQEVEERLTRRKQLQAQNAARMQVNPQIPDEKTQNFLDKWGVSGPEVETSVSTTDRDISEAVPLPVRQPKNAKPFGRK